MKPYDQRDNSIQDIIPMIQALGPKFPDANVMAFQPPALPGASSTGSLSMYIMNLAGEDVSTMNERAQEFLAKARQRPEVHHLKHQHPDV